MCNSKKIRYMVMTLLILFGNLCLQSAFAQNEAKTKFLLIMGPSGTGKSTIINYLKKMDAKFCYITPLTTRQLRPNETDKIEVSKEEMSSREKRGDLLVVNEIYGILYGTPKYLIDKTLSQHKYPVLDWPIDMISVMEKTYGNSLFRVYIQPEDETELSARLSNDNRDANGKRLTSGKVELSKLAMGEYDQHIDLKLVNKKDAALDTAKIIYAEYLKSL